VFFLPAIINHIKRTPNESRPRSPAHDRRHHDARSR
jgi:hypothetical protein